MATKAILNERPLAVKVAVACLFGLGMSAGQANAIGLLAAYEAALKNDPVYRVAFYEKEASKENRAIGRSFLLPSLSSGYSVSQNRADTETDAQTLFGPQHQVAHPKYISRSANITLRQPIINYEIAARYRESVAQTDAGAVKFVGDTQELALRVVGAYMEVLFTGDQLSLVTAQRDSYREQASVNARLFEKGEGSRTDMIETQARLELADAVVLEAQDNQRSAKETLASVLGHEPESLDPLVSDFKTRPFDQRSLDDWIKSALANNPDLKTQELAIVIAREAINKGKAGHMPRLDFVGALSKSASDTLATSNQESLLRSIGFQLSVPLYQGGYNSAITRQAVASHDRAKANLKANADKVVNEVRKEYALVQSSIKRIAALERAVDSAKLLIKATEQSIKGGVRINLDLLNAQQQLYSSQRDLAQARYGYLLGSLRLRAAAGSLAFDDVREVASYFR